MPAPPNAMSSGGAARVDIGSAGQDLSEDVLQKAAEVIRAGGIVAFPTDTLYGVACDAWNAEAIQKLYKLKSRVEQKPVAIVVAKAEDVATVSSYEPTSGAAEVVKALLPGPFTVVVGRGASLLPELNRGTTTIGVRVVPDAAPCATKICVTLGDKSALALTSANVSGCLSPLCADDFLELHEGIDLILDGGKIPATSNAGSTVIDLSKPGQYAILREGVAGGKERVAEVAAKAGLTLAGSQPAAAPQQAQAARSRSPRRSTVQDEEQK
eukprot:TRINITY_DN103972_c0_g1_i1.p1 TRINITY_DN103972_c0_g1~~TRINITY_DN103972_c0_g1_i1.p1  ORF type:complete len:269 (-),score=64.61 TRINITY_DN103972_c0_g1_i1:273-1079(-)